MSLILNIDTALDTASVALAENGIIIRSLSNATQKDHAQFVHTAIKKLFDDTGKVPAALDAISVVIGPGSYTGLRVGMATAKGLCYAWKQPMIGIGSLAIISHSANAYAQSISNSIICPMIDARRMEVFTALFDQNGNCLLSPHAMILNAQSFEIELQRQPIVFTGNGADKLALIVQHPNAHVYHSVELPTSFASLSQISFNQKEFLDIHLSEPLYVKEHESMFEKKKS
jgi:tRNA threonylcarbamoyladenosine biosynthesis protein TsaB